MNALYIPSSPLDALGPVSAAFRQQGINNFSEGLKWTHSLPYGRNSDRANYMLIFQELVGTCSTKHAPLAALANENGIQIKLQMAICKLDVNLEPKASSLLEMMEIDFFPEAHCYLQYEDQNIDITFPNQSPTLKIEIIEAQTKFNGN